MSGAPQAAGKGDKSSRLVLNDIFKRLRSELKKFAEKFLFSEGIVLLLSTLPFQCFDFRAQTRDRSLKAFEK